MTKKNKRIRNKKKIIIKVLLIVICVCGSAILLMKLQHKDKTNTDSNKKIDTHEANKIENNDSKTANKEKLENNIVKNDNEKAYNYVQNQPAGEYKPWTIQRTDGKKIAYLTFDDGPSVNTEKILRILNENNVKATFFLIGKNAENNSSLVKEEVADGEMIGNHTYSHELNYKEGTENFVNDINKCEGVLKSIIGPNYNAKLVRFPGGSFGNRLAPYREAATKAGYEFVDWNDEIGDADGYDLPVTTLLSNLKKYTKQNTVVILMHDAGAKKTTVQALPEVIEYLRSNGYSFDILH